MAKWINNQERPFWAKNLRILRHKRYLRLADVSKATGVHVASLSEYETGRSVPGLEAILRLLEFYEAKFEDVFIEGKGVTSATSQGD